MPQETQISKESIHYKARVSTIRPVAPRGEKPAPPPELGLSPPGEELRRWWPAPVVHAANRRTNQGTTILMDATRTSQCVGVACVPRMFPSAKHKILERPLWPCVSAIPVRDETHARSPVFLSRRHHTTKRVDAQSHLTIFVLGFCTDNHAVQPGHLADGKRKVSNGGPKRWT